MGNRIFSITGADPSSGNCGVGALAYGALETLYSSYPDACVYLVDYYKKEEPIYFNYNGKTVRIDRKGLRFSWKPNLRNNIVYVLIGALILKILPFKIIKKLIFKLLPILENLTSIQIAYSLAGGDSFSDIYGYKRFIYVILPIVLFKLLKIPIVHLPQTYGPYQNKICSLIAKWLLSGSLIAFARDQQSLQLIQKLLKNNKEVKTKLMYDVGFLLKPETVEVDEFIPFLTSKTKSLIGFNISGLLLSGGYNGKNQFNLTINYERLCYELIDFFIDQMNCNVILLPHVFDSRNENDLDACKHVYKKYNGIESIGICNRILMAREIKYLISHCDLFVGSRMHACIAALSLSIPTVPLAYSRKFDGVMKTIGLSDCVVDMRNVEINAVFSKINEIYENRIKVSKHLDDIMKEIKGTLRNVFLKELG